MCRSLLIHRSKEVTRCLHSVHSIVEDSWRTSWEYLPCDPDLESQRFQSIAHSLVLSFSCLSFTRINDQKSISNPKFISLAKLSVISDQSLSCNWHHWRVVPTLRTFNHCTKANCSWGQWSILLYPCIPDSSITSSLNAWSLSWSHHILTWNCLNSDYLQAFQKEEHLKPFSSQS